MAEATIPVTTPIKEEKGMDDLRVVYVKVKGEQEMVNAVIDTGAQMPVVRPDVVEGQSINNRGSIQITSAFGEHEMGEVKDSNMELNDFRHGVVPVSKNLVNDMLICSSDYEVLIENSQMIRNPAKLREPSKKEGIISSTDSKSVCSQEVVTDLLPETQSLLNVPNGDLVAVKINGSNVQTNGQGIKESKGEVVLTCEFKKESCIVLGVVAPVRNVFLILLTQPRKKSTPCSKLVMRIVYGRDLCNAAMKYGLANEEIARKQYEREYSTEVKICGLFVDKDKPFLYASPDGLVGDDGLIEIKCPYSARFESNLLEF
ncbi:yqaJ domain-containing protein [Trichonephila clavipes]|nr:yqaJ domain-containing protein [Trichonephila clavipes]